MHYPKTEGKVSLQNTPFLIIIDDEYFCYTFQVVFASILMDRRLNTFVTHWKKNYYLPLNKKIDFPSRSVKNCFGGGDRLFIN